MEIGDVINMSKWIEEHERSFAPPVCNKLMHGGQLKVMYVGGPNVRRDFHIDNSEEFFYQVKGDMELKVMEKGKPKTISIKEGQVFRIQSRVPHSPQRKEGTVGLVIERERLPGEKDGLRYYCDDDTTKLYEAWFYCQNLVKDLPPYIKAFFASEQNKTGKPIPGTFLENTPLKDNDSVETVEPQYLQKWIEDSKAQIDKDGFKELFGNGEFQVNAYGEGHQDVQTDIEMWLWQLEGQAVVTAGDTVKTLNKDDTLLIQPNVKFSVDRKHGSYGLTFVLDGRKNK